MHSSIFKINLSKEKLQQVVYNNDEENIRVCVWPRLETIKARLKKIS